MDQIITNNKLRWDTYVLIKGVSKINGFFTDYFNNKSKKILFIMGKGFDIRMNEGIKEISKLENCFIKVILVEFEEGPESSSNEYSDIVENNVQELYNIKGVNIEKKVITLWRDSGRNKVRVGDKMSADIFNHYNDIKEFKEIIVDISAFPRGIYFSLIGKLLTLIDLNKSLTNQELHNLFILTSENAKIDEKTKEEDIDDDLKYTFGFGGELELTSDDPVIWFPILGENKKEQILRAHSKINPHEICPLLPFPSKDPRRSDKLIIEYHQLLFDELRIESQNLLYVPEQNPFEAYRNLTNAIINYNKTLSIINGCKVAVSTFSSKLLSIGALMTAYELNSRSADKICVGILNVDSKGYVIENGSNFKDINNESELFLSWLTGDPYNL